ncbi:MAG: NAD(P)H-dependent oxidoreductase subunit E [Vitreoscilla sp.]|nr:NAD(P)H-dependent oxidoreductase subunit E [Burkholderiales bacterium]MBP6338333.1 NAD(P)H-dependent oxidoreductase subunit E [Vitreoscilla sp.]MBP6674934.1 NAD(P)H-dependent oxidoreductase subunit E [Vitreoscilla sp.]
MSTPTMAPAKTPQETSIPLDAVRERLRRKGSLKGRQPDDASRAEVRALVGTGPLRRDLLIEYLHVLNDQYRGLYQRHLVALAAEMRLGMAAVVEVASFYHHFEVLADDATPPRLTVRVCDSLSCAMAGSATLMNALAQAVGPDVAVQHAPCVGRCEQAPVAVVGQRPVPRATVNAVLQQVNANESSHPLPAAAMTLELASRGAHEVTGPDDTALAPAATGYAAYRAAGGYQLAAEVVNGERDAEEILKTLEDSGLRGLGGAGFPAGRKWRIVRGFAGPRIMAVNIDEGEPGTFKDRTYLERDPHRFLEGILIAAQVVGTERVFIYLRDEYHGARALLQRELAALQANPPCPLPGIELRRGAGAYICGEESAMIESIEGKRGEPRLRPPYIAEVGVFGLPTLEHNFETLYWVRDIVQRGAAWFSSFGRRGRKGLRSFSVSGRVARPGVKLAPAGISLRELVDEYCGGMAEGHTLYGYLPGGASGGILPARLADEPLDFDTLQPHGCFIGSAAVVVLGQNDLARDAALNAMRFFADESCGQCTPCRVGTEKAAQLMARIRWDHGTLADLAQVMGDASICGLGQAAPNPIRCVQQYFPDEVGFQPGASA